MRWADSMMSIMPYCVKYRFWNWESESNSYSIAASSTLKKKKIDLGVKPQVTVLYLSD